MEALRRGMCIVTLCVVALAALAEAGAAPKGKAGVVASKGDPAAKVLIRPKYAVGQQRQYRLQLYGGAAWTPAHQALAWGRMKTDLRYVLAAKVVRPSGACTFNVVGQYLNSAGQGPKGSIEVEASRTETAVRLNGKHQVNSNKGLLARPMTVTLGPRGAYRFSTGLAPVAIYLLPHVDRRFWTALTVAPLAKVAPGDGWTVDLDVAVPGSKGKPLSVQGTWAAGKFKSHGGRKVMPLTLSVKLDLKDANVLLKNGDRAHVARGVYEAHGTALWDVDNGLLVAAEAVQDVHILADAPSRRELKSEVKCTLELLAASDPKSPK